MCTLEEFIKNKSDIVNQQIYDFYEQFKSFMYYKELPVFLIKYVNSKEDENIDYNAKILPFQEPITLIVDIQCVSSDRIKPLLMHEFTHLYDYEILSKFYNKKEMKDCIKLYSEFHSAQIETLYKLNTISNIHERCINIETNFDIKNIIKKETLQFIQSSYRYDKTIDAHTFYQMKAEYMYLCGIIYLFNQISNQSFKMEFIIDVYKPQMHKIIELLNHTHYSKTPSKEILNEIIRLNSETDQIFIEEYKNRIIIG